MLRLKHLHAKGVRGILDGPDLIFESGGLLLCGDNGTGKSSFVDAIEKVLTGKCSSLDGVAQSVSWNKQGTHIQSKKPSIELTLTDGSNDCLVTLGADPQSIKKPFKSYVEAARWQSFILRRRTLLDFIDATDSARYEAIESFLQLDQYMGFEQQVRQLLIDARSSLTSALGSKNNQEIDLRKRFHLQVGATINEAICLQLVNTVLNSVKCVPIASLAEIHAALQNLAAKFG
jgi:hypothetical protein